MSKEGTMRQAHTIAAIAMFIVTVAVAQLATASTLKVKPSPEGSLFVNPSPHDPLRLELAGPSLVGVSGPVAGTRPPQDMVGLVMGSRLSERTDRSQGQPSSLMSSAFQDEGLGRKPLLLPSGKMRAEDDEDTVAKFSLARPITTQELIANLLMIYGIAGLSILIIADWRKA